MLLGGGKTNHQKQDVHRSRVLPCSRGHEPGFHSLFLRPLGFGIINIINVSERKLQREAVRDAAEKGFGWTDMPRPVQDRTGLGQVFELNGVEEENSSDNEAGCYQSI